MMNTCVIIDEDFTAIKYLKGLIGTREDIRCVNSFKDLAAAIEYINNYSIDIVFMETKLPRSSLKMKEDLVEKVQVIYVTSSPTFALDAYNEGATDYIIKPVKEASLNRAINKAVNLIKLKREQEKTNTQSKGIINVKHNNKSHIIDVSDLILVESKKEYVEYHTKKESIRDFARLKDVCESLKKYGFLRIHKSFIVNISCIAAIEKNEILLKNGRVLPIGKVWQTDVFNLNPKLT